MKASCLSKFPQNKITVFKWSWNGSHGRLCLTLSLIIRRLIYLLYFIEQYLCECIYNSREAKGGHGPVYCIGLGREAHFPQYRNCYLLSCYLVISCISPNPINSAKCYANNIAVWRKWFIEEQIIRKIALTEEIPTPEIIESLSKDPDFLLLIVSARRRHEKIPDKIKNRKTAKTEVSHKFITFTDSQKKLWWKICSWLCLKWWGKWSWANWKLQNSPFFTLSGRRTDLLRRVARIGFGMKTKIFKLFPSLFCIQYSGQVDT